ncbi:MAG: hypothetical protein GY861_15385, partial [bacterium]|nr:hypothetical protein [bacterium]
MIDEWVKYAKKRVKKGEHLEAVIQDLPNHGLSQEDAERVLTKIIDEKHGSKPESADTSSNSLVFIIVGVLLFSLLAIFLFTLFTGEDEEEIPVVVEQIDLAEQEEKERLEEVEAFWNQYKVPFPDPVQKLYDQDEIVIEFLHGGSYKITYVADYKLAAMVGHRQDYHDFREIS